MRTQTEPSAPPPSPITPHGPFSRCVSPIHNNTPFLTIPTTSLHIHTPSPVVGSEPDGTVVVNETVDDVMAPPEYHHCAHSIIPGT